MALIDQQFNVEFRGGVDLKTDKRLVIPSKLLVANNVEFEDKDTIITRYGLAQRTLLGGFTDPVRMFEHASTPTIEYADGSTLRAPENLTLYSAYGAAAVTDEVNVFGRVGVTTRRAQSTLPKLSGVGVGIPAYDRNFDVAVGVTNYMLAWEEAGYTGRMAVKYSIRRLDNDVEIQFGIFSGAGGSTDVYVKPRVIYDSVNARFSIWTSHFLSGNTNFDVEASRIPEIGGALTGPTVVIAVPAGGTVEGATGLEALFDVAFHAAQQAYGVVARQTDALGTIRMAMRDLTFGAIVSNTSGVPAVKPVSLTAHVSYGAGVMIVHALFGAGASLKGYRLPSNTGVQSAEVTITTVAATLMGRVVVTDLVAGSSLLIAVDNFTATTATFATTYYLSCSTAHAGTSRTAIGTNCFLAGRIFTMRGRRYVPIIFTSAQYQSVVLVLDLDCAQRNLGVGTTAQPAFIARLDWGDVANPSPLALDSARRVPGCAETLLPYLKYEANTRLAGVTNVTPVEIGFASFAAREQLGSAKWNGVTYLAGALPMVTDGQQIVEEGFHWNPEVVGTVVNGLVVIPPVATGAGIYDFPAIGSYVVAFTESWQDAQGNWHESGTSFLCSVTTTAGNLGINPTIIRPPSLKRNQAKLAAGYKTGLTMYRTLKGGTNTTLYLAHSLELSLGSGYVNDTDLPFGEPIYTEGGVLGNTPAPSCRQITHFDSRLVLSGCGDGSLIYFTKQGDVGFAAEFVSDDVNFQQIIPAEAGRVVATAEMNGKLAVVVEKGIGIIYGTGPTDAGVGKYTPFETVARDAGGDWNYPKSVLLAAEGLWFLSGSGIRLFNGQTIARDSTNKYIGSEVDQRISFGTGGVVALPGGYAQQTLFFTGAEVLVWDQTWGQFTVFLGHTCVDACNGKDARSLNKDTYFIVKSSGDLQFRSLSDFEDHLGGGTSAVIGVLRTAQLQFGGIQGYQRVRNMLLLGSYDDTSSITVAVGYDGSAGLNDEVVDYNPPTSEFQFEHQFWTQRCQSIQLSIQILTAGAGRIRLTDLALSVAVKKGPWKSAEVK